MSTITTWWNRFWFTPVPTTTLALFRIVYGITVFLWALSLAPDALTFYGADGLVPSAELPAGQWGLLNAVTDDRAVVVAIGTLLLASLATALGYHARVATVVVFIILLSLRRRNPVMFNSGDNLLRHMGFFLALAPSGAALSLDRWRRAPERFWTFPERAPWALRLIQIQVSLVYLFSVWAKARSEDWIDGTAVFDTLRVGDVTRFGIPYAWTDSLILSNLLTYGTLLIEVALAILIWNRRARPLVLAAGVALHLFIEATVMIGFFSTAILVSYVSFIPEDAAGRWLQRARETWGRSDRAPDRRPTRTTAEVEPAREPV